MVSDVLACVSDGECQGSCGMALHPGTTLVVADLASFKYTVVGREQLWVVPRQRVECCVRAAR